MEEVVHPLQYLKIHLHPDGFLRDPARGKDDGTVLYRSTGGGGHWIWNHNIDMTMK